MSMAFVGEPPPVKPTDRIKIPYGATLPAGEWQVDGEPVVWPMDTVSRFPASWLVTVVVVSGGGRDSRGNPLPATETPLHGCLVAPRSTSDPVDRTDLTTSTGVLYAPGGLEVPLRRGA